MIDNNTNNKKSFIVIRDGIIVEVSEDFTRLTDYSTDELMGKSYLEVSQLLKCNPLNKFEYMNDGNLNIYLFTKLLESREVVVSLENGKNKGDTIYFFDEKENSRLVDKFPYVEQLFLENKCRIAIYSAPDLILLKGNQKYIDYLNEPFNKRENCIGEPFHRIVKGFKGSVTEDVWTNIILTGKIFYEDEVMYDGYDRDKTYWDSSIVPIYEDGKVKYFIKNAIEITERVVNRKIGEEQAPIMEDTSKNSGRNKVILCVEDNLINQEIMENIVKRKGYKYIEAYNGNEALDILKDNKVDLILMDVQMPELNGFETTELIREGEINGKHMPIIAMTAYAMLGDKDKCIKAGMDNYISKPFNIEELYNIFEFYLGE